MSYYYYYYIMTYVGVWLFSKLHIHYTTINCVLQLVLGTNKIVKASWEISTFEQYYGQIVNSLFTLYYSH